MDSKLRNNEILQSIKAADIDIVIQMLNKYMDAQAISPLVSVLETLKTEPQNEPFKESMESDPIGF